jgi:hypothetical protein
VLLLLLLLLLLMRVCYFSTQLEWQCKSAGSGASSGRKWGMITNFDCNQVHDGMQGLK